MNRQNNMDENPTPQEGTNPEELESLEVVEPEIEVIDTETEDIDALKERLVKAEEAKRQLTARAKRAEDSLKAIPKPAQNINNALSAEQIEITVLRAQGISDDEVNYLKKLAKVNETSIIDAQKDELFHAFKARKEAENKSQKAKLGSSRGSSVAKVEKNFNTPNLSEAEFKELWKEQQGK